MQQPGSPELNKLKVGIENAIRDRNKWSSRQSVWYQFRHDGQRRVMPPWPGAPDMHFALIDATITKMKPLYNAQLEQQDTLATFTSQLPTNEEANTLAAYKFDYGMKQRSNFVRENLIWDDRMLMAGHGIMKVTWNSSDKKKVFEAVDPEFIIVPTTARLVQDLDWIVHVQKYSREAFSRSPIFSEYWKQDENMDKLIGRWPKPGEGLTTNWKEQREGITTQINGTDDIIVWETWHRDPEKFNWLRSYTNPAVFGQEISDVGTTKNPYEYTDPKTGKDHDLIPFVKQDFELKEDGWYSSRGVCEILAPFENGICGIWNAMLDAITLICRPFLQPKQPGQTIPNGTNLMLTPGSIMPIALERVDLGQVAINYEQQMQEMRRAAEYLIQTPDYGALSERGGGTPTAHEVEARVQQSTQTNDIRAKMKRLALIELYNLCWIIDCQYDPESAFIANGEWTQLQDGSVHSDYHIEVSGSADGWNRAQKQQTMVNLFQMLKGDPFIEQMNLHRKLLEVMTPDSTRKLLTSPQQAQTDAGNQQALESAVMDTLNYPWPVKPSDAHPAHIQNIVQMVMGSQAPGSGIVISPNFAQHLLVHGEAHMDGWMKQDKQGATQAEAQIMPALQILQSIIQQGAQSGPPIN